MTSRIVSVHAREVLDSRGRPTVEAEVRCASGEVGRAIAPSGASTGRHEAHERRDGQPAHYDGLGVREVARAVDRELAPRLVGGDPLDQRWLDEVLTHTDGTPNKSRLGGNALLAVSLAGARAAALCHRCELVEHLQQLWRQLPAHPHLAAKSAQSRVGLLGTAPLLPLPMVNMISGGLHAGGQIDIQDVLAVPVGAASFREALEWIVRIYRRLGELLKESGLEGVLVGDEGGYGPRLPGNAAALDVVTRSIERAGLQPGTQVALAVDAASTHFHSAAGYRLHDRPGVPLDAEALGDVWHEWAGRYPLLSLEDGCAEDDWEGWSHLTTRLGRKLQLVGDDLFVTNTRILKEGIAKGIANSILIKINQIGTLTETFAAVEMAKRAGYTAVISHRSGETEDSTIADIAVGLNAM
ncbi:MAG: phosphopyruvate hydratase, partial [Planctomycetaceae bacterium]